ncbi:MAG: response regulator [Niabella sp.]
MKKHVLIIDDEPIILKLLHFVLSKSYNVTAKNNGYDAVNWLEEGNLPDLIILDLMMPYFNGTDFFKSLKISGLYANIPVIVLTGNADTETIQAQLKFPVELIMKKPFNPEKLKNAIESIFESNKHRMEFEIAV